jgi:hypothetical protein
VIPPRGTLTALAILLALAGAVARAQAPASGLYAVVRFGGVEVKVLDGTKIRLGKKLNDALDSPLLISRSRDNEQYLLLYNLRQSNTKHVAIYADGFCLRGLRGDDSGYLKFTSGAAAQAFSKSLGIPLQLQAHPGYVLATRFVPMKAAFSGKDPVIVTLEIENVGHVPVTFWVNEFGGRDAQFGFTALGPSGKPIPDTGDAAAYGDSYNKPRLAPGETFRREVDLRKWFTFSLPGAYQLVGTYELTFFNPVENGWPIWDDFAAAAFSVTIK